MDTASPSSKRQRRDERQTLSDEDPVDVDTLLAERWPAVQKSIEASGSLSKDVMSRRNRRDKFEKALKGRLAQLGVAQLSKIEVERTMKDLTAEYAGTALSTIRIHIETLLQGTELWDTISEHVWPPVPHDSSPDKDVSRGRKRQFCDDVMVKAASSLTISSNDEAAKDVIFETMRQTVLGKQFRQRAKSTVKQAPPVAGADRKTIRDLIKKVWPQIRDEDSSARSLKENGVTSRQTRLVNKVEADLRASSECSADNTAFAPADVTEAILRIARAEAKSPWRETIQSRCSADEAAKIISFLEAAASELDKPEHQPEGWGAKQLALAKWRDTMLDRRGKEIARDPLISSDSLLKLCTKRRRPYQTSGRAASAATAGSFVDEDDEGEEGHEDEA